MPRLNPLLNPHFTLALAFGIALVAAATAIAEERTVLILHTNDFHDHARPGYNGQGGLPYVAGYINSVRAERDDILLLDAGDVREKGDWVAHLTEGRLMFEAMGMMGYDAVVPGNHDVNDPFPHLDQCQEWLGQPFIVANIINPDGSPRYTPSRVFEVNGVRVGVIGITRRDKGEAVPGMDFSRRVLAEEAERLRDEVHVLVALVHEGGMDAVRLAQAAPDIDVVVAGHTHQTHQPPVVIEETGALMVQAGSNALFVGRLELTVNTETGEIVSYEGDIIPMDHDTITPDTEILEMVAKAEAELCPEASVVIAHADRLVGQGEVAQLAAEALRKAHGADIALAMADRVVRNNLPEGPIDINAVFRAISPPALETLTVEVTGEELLTYLAEYYGTWERPHWSGAVIVFERGPDRKHRVADTDIDPERTYRVAVAMREWTQRLEEFVEAADTAEVSDTITTDIALRQYIKALELDETPLCDHAAAVLEAATSAGVAAR